jgi:hypothetical protein
LRITSGLSVGIEIDFIDAGLLRCAWLSLPSANLQFDLAEFLHSKAAPTTPSCSFHSQPVVAYSLKLVNKGMQVA